MSEKSEKKPVQQDIEKVHDIPISGLYESWFLDYASYVILERAVPAIEDGLKPVQRRILHAMKEMDDGRFNKVANIIGSTMQYHPHGDASIGEAIVGLGQKDLLLDTQGNWGDARTGDNAAAPRYIEARLSKFAHEVVFNPEITPWQASYDGRKKEPVTLPVKFPLLLAQGVEGIAVGLATKVLPHNFRELCEASILYLQNEAFVLYPDFPTGGLVDVSDYKDGLRGGKIRIRAKIEEYDKKTLIIKEIPFGTTTVSLIDSILKANDSGKIKIKKVNDNTAKDVEIEIQLQPGTSPDITIDALYAFTDCEVSISPNACVILGEKPQFMGVSEILKVCTQQTKDLLKMELEIQKKELQERILFTSLLKIFISEGMYKNKEYENAGSPEKCFEVLDRLFATYVAKFYRPITHDDYTKLIAKPLSSITRFDVQKADELMKNLEDEIQNVENNLNNLTTYTITWYKNLLEKYGANRERRTEIKIFDTITANQVAAANEKLYVNRAEGFIGYGLKKDEYVTDCSDIDDIIIFRKDGIFKVVKVGEKVFVGKDILHVNVFKKNDERTVYNMIYLDGKTGRSMVKRFQIGGITRDKDYDLTMGNKGSKILYLAERTNGESEVVTITLTPSSAARNKVFDFDFGEILIKGRSSNGNILTPYPVKQIKFKEIGKSTLGGVNIYFDETTCRLNTEQRGKFLGNFETNDKILVVYTDGNCELTNFELTNRYSSSTLYSIEKFNPDTVCTLIHYSGEDKTYYVKRFKIESQQIDKKHLLIHESKGSKLILFTTENDPEVEIEFASAKDQKAHVSTVHLKEYIDVKGWKATGNKLASSVIREIRLVNKATTKPHPANHQTGLFETAQSTSTEIEKLKGNIPPGTTLELPLT